MFYMKNTKSKHHRRTQIHLCFPIITNWNTNKWLFDSLFVFPIEWHQTKKQKTAYTGDFAFLCSFFTLRIERNEAMFNGSYLYFPFYVYELGKRKRKTNLPFFILYHGLGKRKTKGRYTQHNVLFRFFLYSSCKRKNENIYNGSYFYFSFFVCGLRKKKRILRYPFPIFYHEIEKRKTKGRYIHGPYIHAIMNSNISQSFNS